MVGCIPSQNRARDSWLTIGCASWSLQTGRQDFSSVVTGKLKLKGKRLHAVGEKKKKKKHKRDREEPYVDAELTSCRRYCRHRHAFLHKATSNFVFCWQGGAAGGGGSCEESEDRRRWCVCCCVHQVCKGVPGFFHQMLLRGGVSPPNNCAIVL